MFLASSMKGTLSLFPRGRYKPLALLAGIFFGVIAVRGLSPGGPLRVGRVAHVRASKHEAPVGWRSPYPWEYHPQMGDEPVRYHNQGFPWAYHPLLGNVLKEKNYTFVTEVPSVAGGRLKRGIVGEGDAAAWERLCRSFDERYFPVDAHAPTGDHHIIGWFARCPEDLERTDIVEALVRARDEHRELSKEVVVPCVFFADPLDEHQKGPLDPFKKVFPTSTMKTVADTHSVFVFYLSQFWLRDNNTIHYIRDFLKTEQAKRITLQEELITLLENKIDLAVIFLENKSNPKVEALEDDVLASLRKVKQAFNTSSP